jgi:hypothetical protein
LVPEDVARLSLKDLAQNPEIKGYYLTEYEKESSDS